MAEQDIFPYLQPTAATPAAALPILKEVAWDFANDVAVLRGGIPVVVEREQAVLVWAWHALHTERWRWPCFSGQYGNDPAVLIAQSYQAETKHAEVQRYVEECLLACPYITAVTGIEISAQEDQLLVNFIIQSIYGEIKMEVEQYVG